MPQDGMDYRFGTSGEKEVVSVLNDISKLFIRLNKTISEYNSETKSSKTILDGWINDTQRLVRTYEEVNGELQTTEKIITDYKNSVSQTTSALKSKKAVIDTLNQAHTKTASRLKTLTEAERKAAEERKQASQTKAGVALEKANYKTRIKLAKQASDAEVKAKKATEAQIKKINDAIVRDEKEAFNTSRKLAKDSAKEKQAQIKKINDAIVRDEKEAFDTTRKLAKESAKERAIVEKQKASKIKAVNDAIESDKKQAFKTERTLAQQTAKERVAFEKQMASQTARINDHIIAQEKANQSAIRGTRKSVNELTLSWKSMARVMTVQLAHRALSLVTTKIREAMTAFIELEKRIGEIRTISQEAAISQEVWTRRLIELSNAFGLDVVDQAEAAYQALSNQVVQGAEAINFLRSANELAITTNSQTSESVNALSSVINAFGLSVFEADDIAASLFKTIELGRVRLNEMAEDLGTVSKLSAQLGLSYNDLFGIIDTLTIQGVEFAKANTQIRGIMIKLLKPTAAMKGLFRDLGVSSGEAAVEAYGFWGLMREIQKVTKGSSTEIAKYINRIRGLSGALTITGDGLEDAQRNVKETEEAWGSYQKAIEIAMTTTGKEIEIELNKVKNFFIEEFGKSVLTTINSITKSLGGLSNVLETTTKLFISLIPGVLIGRISSFVIQLQQARATAIATQGAMAGLRASMAALAPAIIGLSATLFIEMLRRQEEERQNFLNSLEDDFASTTEKMNQEVSKTFAGTSKSISKVIKGTATNFTRSIAEQRKVLYRWVDEYEALILGANKEIEDSFKGLFKEITKVLNESERDVDRYEKAFTSAKEAIQSLKDDTAEFGFNIAFSGESPQTQLLLLQAEADRLRDRAIQAIDEIDQKALSQVQKQIRELFKTRLELEENIANEAFVITSKSQAQREYNDLIDQQVQAQKDIVDLAKQEFDLKKRTLLFQELFVGQFKDAYKEYTDIVSLARSDFDTAEEYLKNLKQRVKTTSKLLGLVDSQQFKNLGLEFDAGLVKQQLTDTLELIRVETLENEKTIAKEKFDERKKNYQDELKQLQNSLRTQQEEIVKFSQKVGTLVSGIGLRLRNVKGPQDGFGITEMLVPDITEVVSAKNIEEVFKAIEDPGIAPTIDKYVEKLGEFTQALDDLSYRGMSDDMLKSLAEMQALLKSAFDAIEDQEFSTFNKEIFTASQHAENFVDWLNQIEETKPLSDKLKNFRTLLQYLIDSTTGSETFAESITDVAREFENNRERVNELLLEVRLFEKSTRDGTDALVDEEAIVKSLTEELENLQVTQGQLVSIKNEHADAQKKLRDEMAKTNVAVRQATRSQISDTDALIAKIRENDALKSAMFESYRQSILASGQTLIEQIEASLSALEQGVEKAWQRLQSIQESNTERVREANEKLFQYAQAERTPREQAIALSQRAAQLRQESAVTDDFEEFERLRDELDKVFDAYVRLAEAEPTVAKFDVQETYKGLLNEELKIREKFEDQARKELQAREKERGAEQRRLLLVKETLMDLQDISIEELIKLPTDEAISSFKGLLDRLQALDKEGLIDDNAIQRTTTELEKLKDEALSPIVAFGNDLRKAMDSVAESTARIRQNLIDIADRLEKNKKLKSFGFRQGGRVSGYADGGKVDSILARVTSGEFIVNQAASEKFYSQLLAMNSYKGGQPSQPQTTVGDVNINYRSSGNQQVDIVQIGKGLQRALRQGVISL